MEVIKFTKIINYTALNEAIHLRTSLGEYLTRIDYSFPNGFSKDEELIDNLVFHFNTALSSDQKDELADLINKIDDNYDLVVRHGMQNGIIKDKMTFGKEFIAMFAANNNYREKTAEQIGAMLAKYPSLVICCLTGSIEALYGIMLTVQPDGNIYQDEINEFKKRIELFLGGMNE
jgi:hypothetical protein